MLKDFLFQPRWTANYLLMSVAMGQKKCLTVLSWRFGIELPRKRASNKPLFLVPIKSTTLWNTQCSQFRNILGVLQNKFLVLISIFINLIHLWRCLLFHLLCHFETAYILLFLGHFRIIWAKEEKNVCYQMSFLTGGP